MTHQASPFEAIDPPESRKATSLRAYKARARHVPDPGLWPMDAPECGDCGELCVPTACQDSDGWGLSWDHCEEPWAQIPWLFGDRKAGPKDFEALGFEVA